MEIVQELALAVADAVDVLLLVEVAQETVGATV